ncbi:MAG: hypothetical protein LBJ86_02025, partial [Spirochaetaceae bacterium]|nr:hypothetical protein [Spirochaetaceae bacterium]
NVRVRRINLSNSEGRKILDFVFNIFRNILNHKSTERERPDSFVIRIADIIVSPDYLVVRDNYLLAKILFTNFQLVRFVKFCFTFIHKPPP